MFLRIELEPGYSITMRGTGSNDGSLNLAGISQLDIKESILFVGKAIINPSKT